MFGFSKEVKTKQEILFFLSQQDRYVTIDEIAGDLEMITGQTVTKYLREIEADILAYYRPEQLCLEIRPKVGVRLHRQNMNYYLLLEKIYTKDLIYQIYRLLFLERSFLSEDFCEEYQVSFSTLRRLVQRIKESLHSFEVLIQIGKKTSISGNEAHIRLIFFMVFYKVHRNLSSLSWVDSSLYINKAKQICAFFYENPQEERLEIFSLWLYINHCSEVSDHVLRSKLSGGYAYLDPLVDEIYTERTLNYLLLMTYSLEIFDFEPNLTFQELHENRFSQGINAWLRLFENRIRILEKYEKEIMFHALYKYSLIDQVVECQAEIQYVFQKRDAGIFQSTPYFKRLFEQLWNQFILECPEHSKTVNREFLMDWTYQFVSEEEILPTIVCYWNSALSLCVLKRLEKEIQFELCNRANIVFTLIREEADLVISTGSINQGIPIMVPLAKQDFNHLEQAIQSWVMNNDICKRADKRVLEAVIGTDKIS